MLSLCLSLWWCVYILVFAKYIHFFCELCVYIFIFIAFVPFSLVCVCVCVCVLAIATPHNTLSENSVCRCIRLKRHHDTFHWEWHDMRARLSLTRSVGLLGFCSNIFRSLLFTNDSVLQNFLLLPFHSTRLSSKCKFAQSSNIACVLRYVYTYLCKRIWSKKVYLIAFCLLWKHIFRHIMRCDGDGCLLFRIENSVKRTKWNGICILFSSFALSLCEWDREHVSYILHHIRRFYVYIHNIRNKFK